MDAVVVEDAAFWFGLFVLGFGGGVWSADDVVGGLFLGSVKGSEESDDGVLFYTRQGDIEREKGPDGE